MKSDLAKSAAALSVLALLYLACGGSGGGSSDGGFGGSGAAAGFGATGGAMGGGFGGSGGVVLPEAGQPDALVPPPRDPLCGMGCLPDDQMACAGYDAGAPVEAGQPDAADADSDGPPLDAAGDVASDATMFVVEGGPMQALPGAGAGGAAAYPSGVEEPAFSCHVVRESGQAASRCEEAGRGEAGAPCTASSDCKAGYGCVGEANAGQCRAYCCAGNESCPVKSRDEVGTHCVERPLRDRAMAGVEALLVPVCVPADDCNLGEPFPCPPNQTCTCAEGTACTIVRDDGTTSCVEPGDGVVGDPCPCAAGHVCSRANETCLKVCRLASTTGDCGSGRCQATLSFPEGFGVCVGGESDAG